MTIKETFSLFVAGIALAIILTMLVRFQLIDIAQGIQIIITFVLVLVTVAYVIRTADIAKATKEQAEASVRMAEEMREQRRPIVVPKAFPAIDVPLEATAEEIARPRYSDYFQIYNKGNSPAINLEVLLLNHEKSQFGCLKETAFSQNDEPLVFHPSGLENHLQSTCYLVCRYCSVLSTEEKQIWHETWLPFIPNKSQRGDRIIIVHEELYFLDEFEKKSY